LKDQNSQRGEDRRAVWSWCLYDWANSAFVTCLTTAILPIYYLTLFADAEAVELHVLGMTWNTSGLSLWVYTTGFSMLIVVLLAPFLGAVADLARGKKKFLSVCVYAGALFVACLSAVQAGDYLLCSALYILANALWSAGNIFYDGFLPELTKDPNRMDSISAAGYGVGYLGGGLALLGSLVLINSNEILGMTKTGAIRTSFLIVAVWWALFTIPMLLYVREEKGESKRPEGGYLRAGADRFARTLKKIRRLPNLGRMLLAFLLYNSGIGTTISVAAIYGKAVLKLEDTTLITCILFIQFLGLPTTFAYIALAKKVGTRNAIHIGLAVYIAVVVYARYIDSPIEFWILGGCIALVQGGAQAMSRSLYGSMIPDGMNAEFFGFFSIFNKVGPFIGPLLFGVLNDLTGDPRMAILFLIAFFILGGLALFSVRPKKGREEAGKFQQTA
jgi:UMF1 family MFS transporter